MTEFVRNANRMKAILEHYPQINFVNDHKHRRYIVNAVTGKQFNVGVMSRCRVDRVKEACERLTIDHAAMVDHMRQAGEVMRLAARELKDALANLDSIDYDVRLEYNLAVARWKNAKRLLPYAPQAKDDVL